MLANWSNAVCLQLAPHWQGVGMTMLARLTLSVW
jgi:hypothetical protein